MADKASIGAMAVKTATGSKEMYDSTSLKRWQIQNLDYNVYWLFTMFLGFFGVDYWYLGAPLTGVLKFLTNISTFGYWWIYDILNATFNRPTVELFGPTMPFFGTTGCAAGRFRQADNLGDPERLAKHMNYIIYGIVLAVFGIIGGDSFLLGNTVYAFIRILCLISFIGIPIGLIWWAYNIVNYLFNANYFLDDAWYYLGAASPDGSKCPSFFDKLFGPIISLFKMITGFTLPTPNPIEDWKKVILKKNLTTGLNMQDILDLNNKLQSPGCQKGGAETETIAITATTVGSSLSQTNTHLLSFVLAGTIGLIVVSSIILSLRRSYQNGNKKTTSASSDGEQRGDQENDDVPPEPRVPRVTPKNA
jgi:TM2 domain-containing membrane protein YozV